MFSLSLLFFLPFYAKTRRVALENKIDITCKNKAKMSGDANKAALVPPAKWPARYTPCRALIRGEFSLSFTAARKKQRQHDFHE